MIRKPYSIARTGFTLIEVLVVVAIIALLISVLVPSLARARAQARTSTCASNQRQFGVAVNVWAIENKGVIPRGTGYAEEAGTQRVKASIHWTQLVARSLGIKPSRNYNYWKNYNRVPIDTNEIFQCPERDKTHPDGFLDYIVNAIDQRGPLKNNCSFDPTSGAWHEVLGVTKLRDWKRHSDVIYIMDAATEEDEREELLTYGRKSIDRWRVFDDIRYMPIPSGEIGPSLAYYDLFSGKHMPAYKQDIGNMNNLSPRAAMKMHYSGSNAVFIDGHVEMIKPPGRQGWERVMQYYLVKFGVFDAIRYNITSTSQGNFGCALGDPDYEY
jgi:prepilin-type N-terminal cleavage/methylation domain-containing protein/prepilin-type processing-associated H-X9-DG protein